LELVKTMTPIHFKPNEPLLLAIKETSGVLDDFNVLYETSDGKLLQLPRPAAIKLNMLEVEPGEEFSATKIQQGRQPAEWVFALTARSEKLRAEREAAELAERTKRDLPGQLHASVLRQMPKSARTVIAEAPEAEKGTGTYGPVPQALPGSRKTPPCRVSYRVALREITFAVTGLLKESGEQWNDQAKQDLVSTAFISAAKSGVIIFDFPEGEGR
jgi:hypothetical protein